MIEITPVQELHHDAEGLGVGINKGLAVTHDVGMVERCEDSNLVEGVGFLTLGEDLHLHHFDGVELGVCVSADFVDTGVGTLAQFAYNLEVCD